MPYISPEVVAKAREMDLLTYLRNYEPNELVHFGGNTYCTREHDSLKISNGKWYWFSRGIGGYTALDYLIKVKEAFPMNSMTIPIQSIPAFENIQFHMSVIIFVTLAVLLQMLLIMGVALATIIISGWRKNDMQSMFFGMLILVVPLVLKLMGFDFADWFSISPLYGFDML